MPICPGRWCAAFLRKTQQVCSVGTCSLIICHGGHYKTVRFLESGHILLLDSLHKAPIAVPDAQFADCIVRKKDIFLLHPSRQNVQVCPNADAFFLSLFYTISLVVFSVNSGDCRSDFHHHSPKTYDSALAGSNATLRLRDPTRSSVVGIRDPVPRRLFSCAV